MPSVTTPVAPTPIAATHVPRRQQTIPNKSKTSIGLSLGTRLENKAGRPDAYCPETDYLAVYRPDAECCNVCRHDADV